MSAPSPEILAQTWTWLVPLSVLGSSFVGSLHCAGMCGGLVMTIAPDRPRQIAYQSGRMLSYTGAGALAGLLGQQGLHSLNAPWLSWVSAVFVAAILIGMGWQGLRGRTPHMRLPGFVNKGVAKAWSLTRASRLPRGPAAFLAGWLTLFLPCGYLYGFLAGAIATGSPLNGAAFMLAFWLGTLPALGFGAVAVRKLLQPWVRRAPRVTGALLIGVGLFTLVMRFGPHRHSDTTDAAAGASVGESTTAAPHKCH